MFRAVPAKHWRFGGVLVVLDQLGVLVPVTPDTNPLGVFFLAKYTTHTSPSNSTANVWTP